MKVRLFSTLFLLMLFISSCSPKNTEIMKPYVIEIVTFKYKPEINSENFWKEDAKVQENYTSKQPGFISRESGYSKDKSEVLVVVKWRTNADAETSMQKFMEDPSVTEFINMIDANTMSMSRYMID